MTDHIPSTNGCQWQHRQPRLLLACFASTLLLCCSMQIACVVCASTAERTIAQQTSLHLAPLSRRATWPYLVRYWQRPRLEVTGRPSDKRNDQNGSRRFTIVATRNSYSSKSLFTYNSLTFVGDRKVTQNTYVIFFEVNCLTYEPRYPWMRVGV